MLLHLTSLSIKKVLKESYYKNVILQRPKLAEFISGFEMLGSGFYSFEVCNILSEELSIENWNLSGSKQNI